MATDFTDGTDNEQYNNDTTGEFLVPDVTRIINIALGQDKGD